MALNYKYQCNPNYCTNPKDYQFKYSSSQSANYGNQYSNPYKFNNSYSKPFNSQNIDVQNDKSLKLSNTLALRKSPGRKTPNKSVLIIEENCSELLKLIINVESEAEKQKYENLCKIREFSVDDMFLFFESDNTQNDILTPEDIKEGLINKLNYNYTDEDINLILSKFDLSNDGGLSFPNLFDMLVPYNKRIRDDVEQRESTGNINEQIANGFKNYLDFILDSEKKINDLRLLCLNNKKFDPAKYFQDYIDINGTGEIEIQDLEKFLNDKGITMSQKEADLLFIRLDRDRNGKVNVEEFCNEFNVFEVAEK